jgi:hypothetical protein
MAFNRTTNRNTSRSNDNNRSQARTSGQGTSPPQRSTPTDKMLSYARKIAEELGEDLPQEVEESFDACRAFIDANADSIPPTEKQLAFAERLADSNGEEIPADVLASKRKLSAWLDERAGS